MTRLESGFVCMGVSNAIASVFWTFFCRETEALWVMQFGESSILQRLIRWQF